MGAGGWERAVGSGRLKPRLGALRATKSAQADWCTANGLPVGRRICLPESLPELLPFFAGIVAGIVAGGSSLARGRIFSGVRAGAVAGVIEVSGRGILPF